MAHLNSTTGSGDEQKAICTICFEDLKPILEDLQTLPICGHVFHELCIQQWLEYCPAGKKPTCPVCKQSCSRHNLTRLYFQSTGDSPQLNSYFSRHGPGNSDVETLAEEVRRLEMKLAAVNTTFENQQALLKKLDEELAREEELRKEEIKKEKEYNEQLLYMKMEELSMKTVEIAKLQERGLALAKELAALKLATDLNLEEEDMVRLASIGHGSNMENALDVLKKSLALRNKSYKDLMIQCNILGRSETRTCKKLDKAREMINKLKIRLQEVEKALEEKENEDLRDFKDSSRLKRVNLSYTQQNVSCPTIKDQTVWQYATENSDHVTLSSNGLDQFCRTERTKLKKISSPLAYERSNHAVDRNMDSYNLIDVNNLKLIPDSNRHPALAVKRENGQADQDAEPISGIRSNFMQNANAYAYTKLSDGAAYYKFGDDSKDGEEGSSVVIKKKVTHRNISMVTREKIHMDGIQKEVPYLADQSEAAACVSPNCLGNTSFFGSLVPEMVNRNTSRWSKQIQSVSSSGDLIVVGADGRGGRIKVLKARDECLGDSVTTVGSKRQKHGAKLRSQFNIEHFFKKTQ